MKICCFNLCCSFAEGPLPVVLGLFGNNENTFPYHLLALIMGNYGFDEVGCQKGDLHSSGSKHRWKCLLKVREITGVSKASSHVQ
jgi:hypothetical protein